MESGFQIDNLLGIFKENPELLSGVMSMAGKLAGGLGNLSHSEPSSEDAPLLPVPSEKGQKKAEMHKHKKLIEALMLYVSEEKRPKLEMVLKMLEIVELAESLRG